MNGIASLLEPTRIYLGAIVKAAYLIIWPRDTWPEGTDTKLYLKLQLVDHNVKYFVLDSDPDGVTPRFVEEEYQPAYSFSQINERLLAWTPGDNYDLPEFSSWEVFNLEGSLEYGWIIESRLISFELVCIDDFSSLVGMLLHFDVGKSLWSHPYTDGNMIEPIFNRSIFPNDWRFIKLRMDMDCRSTNDCHIVE